METSLCVTSQWSLLSSANTVGSPSCPFTDDEDDLLHLHTSLGLVSRKVTRGFVDDTESYGNGIGSIYKIGTTLGQ